MYRADGLGVLVPMPNELPRSIDSLAFCYCRKTEPGHVVAYVVFGGGKEIDRFCVDLEDPYFMYGWCTKEMVSLADQRAQDREQEALSQLV